MTTAGLRKIWSQSDLLLNATQVSLGIEHTGSDARLACIREALQSQRRISIGAIGGSITAGSTYSVGKSTGKFTYHEKLQLALNDLYPPAAGPGHALLNGGVPGTGPTYMEHCVHDHLPADVDLVLLEYAVNTDRAPWAFERLLRTLLRHPRAPALVVVNAHRFRAIRRTDGRTDKCWNKKWETGVADLAGDAVQWAAQTWGEASGPVAGRADLGCMPMYEDQLNSDEDAIASFCRHYDVPLVSMRGATLDAVRRGSLLLPSFMNDCRHPKGEGHTFLAQSLLERVTKQPSFMYTHTTTSQDTCRRAPALELPAPLFNAASEASPSSTCARGGKLGRYAKWTDGFLLTDEGRGPGKLGFVATRAGASMGLCLPAPTAGTKSHLWLGYLRSYEHMGRLSVSCSGSCRCAAPAVIDAHEMRDGVSVTDVKGLSLRAPTAGEAEHSPLFPPWAANGSDAGCCALTLRVLEESSSGEHKFKLMSLLQGGADAGRVQIFSLRVASAAAEEAADGGRPTTGKGGRQRPAKHS